MGGASGYAPRPASQLAGTWVNVDCPRERYTVEGMRVTRADVRGTQNFTLHWDPRSQRLQWGTHGRLWLEWLGDDFVAWVPDSHHARVWRWQRVAFAAPPRRPGHPAALLASSGASGYGPLRRPRACRQTAPYAAPELSPPARWPSERVGRRETTGGRGGGSSGQSAGRRHGRGGQSAPRSTRGSGEWDRSSGSRHRHRRGEHHRRSENYREHERHHHRRRRSGERGGSSGSWRLRGSLSAESGQQLPCGLTPVEVFDLLSREITPDDYELLLRLDKDVVKKPVATADSISSLPTVTFSEAEGGSCAVCLAGFEAGDSIAALPCKHHFHRSCIARWLAECRRTCPLCSADCDLGGNSEESGRSSCARP